MEKNNSISKSLAEEAINQEGNSRLNCEKNPSVIENFGNSSLSPFHPLESPHEEYIEIIKPIPIYKCEPFQTYNNNGFGFFNYGIGFFEKLNEKCFEEKQNTKKFIGKKRFNELETPIKMERSQIEREDNKMKSAFKLIESEEKTTNSSIESGFNEIKPLTDEKKNKYKNSSKKNKKLIYKTNKINVIINDYINTSETNNDKLIGAKDFDKDHQHIITNINSYNENATSNFTDKSSAQKKPIFSSKHFDIKINADDLDAEQNININENYQEIYRRRGRKPQKESKHIHDASDDDNILSKIQVHFLSFIIRFVNDLIQVVLPQRKDLCFKNITYKLKKTVNFKYIEELKTKSIGAILQFKVSPKNKRSDEKFNQRNFEYICSVSPFLKDFFNVSFLDMFNEYYIKDNRTININGLVFNLSQSTKLFVDLIEKNKLLEDKIKKIAEQSYNKKHINPIFVIKKKK